MSDQSSQDTPRLLLRIIDDVSDLQKAVDEHNTRLADHEARLDELDEHNGLGDGSDGLTCNNSEPHIHVEIGLDDALETMVEREQ